jgi:hypothetical protein
MEYSVDQLRDIGKRSEIYVPGFIKGKQLTKLQIIDLLSQHFDIRVKATELGIFPFNRHLRIGADGKTNLLKDRYPQIFLEIHPTRNPGINIDHLTYASDLELMWLCLEPKCECEFHEYSSVVKRRTLNGSNCPVCANFSVGVCACNNLVAKFPEIAMFWHPSNLLPPTAYRPGSNEKVLWSCPNTSSCGCEHVYPAIIKSKTGMLSGCPYCSGLLFCEHDSLLARRDDVSKEWDYERNIRGPETYKYTSREIVHWKCPEGECDCHLWETTIYHRTINGSGCPYCSKSGAKICPHNNLLIHNPDLCVEWSPSNELTPDKYARRSDYKAEWKCRSCSHCWKARIADRTGGPQSGCPACSKSGWSKKQLLYIRFAEVRDKTTIQCHPSEFHIPTTRYHADGYSPELNKIYEFYGDYYHGNPMVYAPSDKGISKTMGELLLKNIKREIRIRSLLFDMEIVWESWWDKGVDAVIDIQRKFRAYRLRKTQQSTVPIPPQQLINTSIHPQQLINTSIETLQSINTSIHPQQLINTSIHPLKPIQIDTLLQSRIQKRMMVKKPWPFPYPKMFYKNHDI